MRTKTLLVIAAIGAAGVATSMAQVFSVNAVGYVTVAIPAKGLALVSNPLNAANNTIAELFKGVPDGTQVYKFDSKSGSYVIATFDALDGAFGPPAAAATTVVPGEGVFVRNASAAEIKITFVGEVMQGSLSNPLPKGLSIRSSQVPQSGDAKTLGLVGEDGDQLYQFNTATQAYKISTFDALDGAWGPALGTLAVGEAFFLKKTKDATWTRTFSVN